MILHYAQRVQSKKAAAKRFDIESKQIRDCEKSEQLMTSAPYIKKLHPG
ncbi:11711_t:CDS:1, partial [Funneliformis geosporum]